MLISRRMHSSSLLRSALIPSLPSSRQQIRTISPPTQRHCHHTTMTSQDPTITTLQQYTTCDVSDALCKLSHPRGGFLPSLTMFSPERQSGTTKIVGPAYTVEYALKEDPRPKHPTHYIDAIPPGAVIFISSPPTPNALYGGLMSTRALSSGAVGTIVNGRFRDLEEQRSLNYPIFARDVGTAPPGPLLKVVGTNVPLTVEEDNIVNPGDYVIADLNGVVVLPKEMAEQALPLMERQVVADGKMAEAIKGGMSFTEASAKYRG